MNFEELLDKAKQGDEQALEELLDMLRKEEPPKEKIWKLGEEPEGEGLFGSERYNRVLEAFREKAEAGDAVALYAVGCLHYWWGEFYEGANPDAYQKRISWYQESYDLFSRAAEQGHAGASYRLGWQAYSELGCMGDREYAGQCWSDATQQRYEDAARQLYELALEFFEEHEGDEDDEDYADEMEKPTDWLGEVLQYGPAEAATWFRERVENGDEKLLDIVKESALDDRCYVNALRCLVEMADAGHEEAQEALRSIGPPEETGVGWDEFDAPMEYLREAANTGSEWGKKTYEAVLPYLLNMAKAGDERNAAVLLDMGVEADGDDGMTLKLLKAVNNGDAETLKALLDAGANPNAWGLVALKMAALGGNAAVIRTLIEAGLDVNAKDDEGWTVLMVAVYRYNEPKAVHALIEAGADQNVKNNSGETALMLGAYWGQTEGIRELLAAGADPNVKDNSGETALMAAAYRGNTAVIRELLKAGADLEAKDGEGHTALTLAARDGHTEVARALLQAGADVNAKNNGGETALDLAEKRGNFEIAELLREAGAVNGEHKSDEDDEDRFASNGDDDDDDDDDNEDSDNPPLVEAAGNGDLDAVKEQLADGADVNARDNFTQTALMLAAQEGHTEIVRELIAAGADVNAQNGLGETALMKASERGRSNVAVIRAIVETRADLEVKDSGGSTALLTAAFRNEPEAVHALIEAGADVSARDDNGETALMHAAKNGNPEMVKTLLTGGADANAVNVNGRTALMRAAWTGNLEAAKLLLDAGAEVDAARNDDVTALIMAAQNGHTEVVKALLDAGADVNSKCDDGRTALDFAEKNNHAEIAELLRAAASGAASADDDDAPLCLSKGETLSLFKKAPGLKRLLIGLGWDVNEDGGDFDLDASAFLLGENGKCARVKDVVFYGSLEHPSGAVKHLGDNRTGEGEGDDEQLVVDLDKAPAAVRRIAFAVSIHEAGERGQTFGQVENAFIRVLDEASGRELARYEPASEFSDETALVVGELYRDGDDWQFRAVGDGLQGGLAALCGRYGIKTA